MSMTHHHSRLEIPEITLNISTRIDDWYLSNPDHNFADANIGPYNFLSSDIFKNLIYGDVFSRIDYHRGF